MATLNLAEKIDEEPEAGSAPDLEQAFFEHAERIERFFLRLGHRRFDAEDMTSQVFLIAHEKLDRYDRARPLLPWLFGIAVNVSRKQRQGHWMKKWIAIALARESNAEASSEDLERTLFEREDAKRVQATLALMPQKKRELLVLRECEELSAKEIGSVVGMAESSIYTALHYARKEFMRLYRQKLFLEGPR